MYFTPFIVTALLPTAISSQWRKIDSHRLTRDEQTWLSTTYVQIFAFIQVLFTLVDLVHNLAAVLERGRPFLCVK